MFTFDLVYSLSLDTFLSFNIDHTVSQISDLALLKCSNMNISRRHYTALEKVLAVDTRLGYTHSFHWVWPDLHTHSSRLALSGSICSVLVQTVLQWTSLDIILGMFFWLFLSPSFFPSSLNPFLLCFLSLPLRFLFLSPPPSCLFFFKQFLLHLRRFLCSLVWPWTHRPPEYWDYWLSGCFLWSASREGVGEASERHGHHSSQCPTACVLPACSPSFAGGGIHSLQGSLSLEGSRQLCSRHGRSPSNHTDGASVMSPYGHDIIPTNAVAARVLLLP